MARKSRRSTGSKKSSSLFAWPRIILIIVPLFAAVFILFNSPNGRAVLGVSDTNFLNLNFDHKQSTSSGTNSSSKCKQNKVTAFSVTSLCDGRNGFKQFSYACQDGTTATITRNCVNVQSAFEYAGKACAKNSQCAKLEASKKLSPKPTHSEPKPTESNL